MNAAGARRFRPIYVVDGRIVDPARLVQTSDGQWAEPQLVRCMNGHSLLGNDTRTLIGWLSCPVPGVRGGHRLTRCLETGCGAVDYRPPLDTPRCACEDPSPRNPYQGSGGSPE